MPAPGDPTRTSVPDAPPGADTRTNDGGPSDGAPTGSFPPPSATPYSDLTPHARGGIGEVFSATDTALHRTVAVKKLQDRRADDPECRRRFMVEAEVTARLEHPGVVPVYALFTDDRGGPAYAMRFVQGPTLWDRLREYHAGTPDPVVFRRLLQSFVQVCQTVAYAHSRGVIHRDLKPQNILLGKFGETLVVDWGLAKVVGRSEQARAEPTEGTLVPGSGGSGDETAMGSAVGTPAYMSPEQAAGRWNVIDHRSDVYGLGAVLYTVLTGKPPLEKGDWPEMQQRIQRGDFPRPRDAKPGVPRGLEAVCLQAMAADPARRYPSAEALAAEVEHWLADEPVLAHRDGVATRARRWATRNRTLVSAAGVLLVAAVAALAAGTVLLGKKNQEVGEERNAARRAADEAEAERVAARSAAAEAEAINAFLTDDLLGQADPSQNSRDKNVTVEEVLAKAAGKIDGNSKFADRPEVEAALRLTIGKTYFQLDNKAEAEKHLRRAVLLRRAGLPPDDPRTLVAQEALADFLNRARGNYTEAEPLARQTWDASKRVRGPTHRATLDALDTYATSVQGIGQHDRALALKRECLADRRAALGAEHPDTLSSMNNLALTLARRGEWAEANQLLREVIAVHERPNAPAEDFASPANYGNNLYFLGELDEAEKILAGAADRAARRLTPAHTFTYFLRFFLARVWVDRGKADRAIETLNEVIAARRKDSPKGDWRIAAYLVELGRANLALSRPEAASEALAEARQMYRTFPPENDYFAPWADACYGVALLALGARDRAEPLLVAAEQKLRGLAVCPKRHYRQTVETLAKLYDEKNEPEKAAPWRKRLAELP